MNVNKALDLNFETPHMVVDLDQVKRNIGKIQTFATITSEKSGERFVLDAGYKSVSPDQGVYPTILDGDGNRYEVMGMSEEHTVVRSGDNSSRLGEKFIMLPYHSCTTTDLWDGTYAISEKSLSEYVIIQRRGKRE